MKILSELSIKWNVSLRGPWETETEKHDGWELNLIPREGHWGDYPKIKANDLESLLKKASFWTL